MPVQTDFMEQLHIATIKTSTPKEKYVLLQNDEFNGVAVSVEEIPDLVEALNLVFLKHRK